MDDTNRKIAELLQKQTYEERMEMAKSLAEAAMEWAHGNSIDDIDDDYFAGLLSSIAEEFLEDTTNGQG